MTLAKSLKALPFNCTMGADPEFILELKGKLLPANSVFRDSGGIMGCDGCSTVGEMRPLPADDVVELVAHIGIVLGAFSERNKMGAKVLAGHYHHGYATGGHIHFAVKGSGEPRSRIIQKLTERLDIVLYDTLMPLLDDKKQMQRRRDGCYGKSGDIQPKTYGFEYRSIGSWLLSPEVATVYLGLAKMCYQGLLLDIPSYIDSAKTVEAHLARFGEYTADVKLAITTLKKLLIEGARNWDADILVNWGVK